MGKTANQPHIKMYWQQGRDLELRAALERDIRKGKGSASAIVRRALRQHYGLEPRPTLPKPTIAELKTLTETAKALADQVQGLRAEVAALKNETAAMRAELATYAHHNEVLRTEVTAMRGELAKYAASNEALRTENTRLRTELLALAYGNREQKRAALETVNLMLASHQGKRANGNGL